MMKKAGEKIMYGVFWISACISIGAVLLICVFLLTNGLPVIREIGLPDFLFGTTWRPGNDLYGIFPMLIGSVYITVGATIVGVPIGLLTAICMAWFCGRRLYSVLKPAVDLLAGIPSVVYGLFGLTVLVPMVRRIWGGNGYSILTASLLLGFMILPTVISVSENALRSISHQLYEGSLALGATHERSVFKVVVPAAGSGIAASVILGIGRAIGETMAVIMVAGNQPRFTGNVTKGIRTLTANIVMEMGYASGQHRHALIATGVVLFVLILCINLLFHYITRKRVTKHG